MISGRWLRGRPRGCLRRRASNRTPVAQVPMLSMLKSRSEVNSVRTVLLMLRDFLDAVGRGKESDRLIFENFFADDVIYTSSSGIAINKEDIMKILDVTSPHRFR